MSNKLIFKDAEKAKKSIIVEQQKEIAKLYNDWADDIAKKAEYYSHKTNSSAPFSERYYRELKTQLRKTSQQVSNEIYNKIKSNMYIVSDEVVKDNVKWLKSFGFSEDGLNAAFSYVPKDTVERLVTGQVYESGWSLSKRIWSDNEQTLKDIYSVMAKGLAEQKPIYDIAKDLESYVRPNARLPWNLRMADGVRIYKKQVDYNVQRLARTLVQHSYQQSFVSTTKNNPFILDYVWRANGSRVCEVCAARNGVHYKKDELPLDHPNGMCVIEPSVDKDMNDKLADWFNSPDGTYPEIDEFASNFGYKPKINVGAQSISKLRSYTDRQIKNASKFLKEFEFDRKSEEYYMSALKNTEQEFQNAFVDALKKKVKEWDYSENGGSFYAAYMQEIDLSDDAIGAWLFDLKDADTLHKKQTLFHEVGHAIDDLARGSNSQYSKSAKFKFKEAMIKDMKEMNNKVKGNDKDFIKALNDMIRDDSSKGVQDAISAMHCKGIGLKDVKKQVRVRWSHSQEYYERMNAKNEAASELFANLCGAKVDPKAQEYMEKFFPNAVEAFERIIKEIGK